MAATAEQITELRRMTAEPTTATYSDDVLTAYIERYPLLDERGEQPYWWDGSTTPPSQTENASWIPTYDLHAAAADVWQEKAGALAARFDFKADGAEFSRSQAYDQALSQARYHASRRAAKTMTFVKWPKETRAKRFPWIGNLAEDDTYDGLER